MFSQRFILPVLFCLIFLISGSNTYSQDVLDPIEEEDRLETTLPSDEAPNLVSETIKTIAPSKKIFILTNNNQSFSKGDFISLLLANKLVCRALVAKTTNDKLSGIKIVKIYNLALWKQLTVEKEVLVLKGDDSYYTNKEKAPTPAAKDKKDNSRLQTDEDLYNSTSFSGSDDDLSLDENNKRLIRPDNLLSFSVGLIEGIDVDNSTKKYTQLNGNWGYQLHDNIWAEAGVGTNVVTDFPSTGLDTRLVNITVKGKYTFNAPFYSYLQPYVGYQTILAISPSAGVPDESNTDQEKLDNEVKLVNDMKKSSIIFGVTILKRIVPGWFIRADLGSDIVNGGLTIEF
jgi:hypothetical protein